MNSSKNSALSNFDLVLNTFEQTKDVLTRYLSPGSSSNDVIELGNKLYKKSKETQPSIMLYGVYNAGKSTLLNALMGESKAEVSDRPQTDKVTPYQWRGFTLYDTPGIDAPEAHEEVAKEQLERCDVVLFVLPSDSGTDEARTYEELIRIVDNKRLVCLIVNNKSEYSLESPQLAEIKDKLIANLQKEAKQKGIPDAWKEINTYLVNARSALKGKAEKKQLLIEKSGIVELEDNIEQFLIQSNTYTIFNTCKNDLKVALNNSEKIVRIAAKNDVLEKFGELKNEVAYLREDLSNTLFTELKRMLIDGQKTMDYSEAGAKVMSESISNELNQLLQAEHTKTVKGKLVNLNSKFKATIATQHADFDSSSINYDGKSADVKNEDKENSSNGLSDFLKSPALDAALVMVATKFPHPIVLGGIAVIKLITGLFGGDNSEAQDAKAHAKLEREMQEKQERIASYIRKVSKSYNEAITQSLEQFFEPIEQKIKEQEQGILINQKNLQDDLNILQQAQKTLS